jgi:hypothetical protein
MIGKLLGMLVSLVAAVCVATVIAAAILIPFYAQSWKLSKERLGQALAILQGTSPESLVPPPPPKKEGDSEQPSFDQVLAAQSLRTRDLEQRELTLRANIQQFSEQLDKIVAERKRVQAVSDDSQASLEAMRAAATGAGATRFLDTLQSLKPKQAKDLVKQQLDAGEIDVVAQTLQNMSDSKRAKIIAEFKTVDEMKQIGDVLNRIRKGQDTTQLVDETEKKLQPPKGPGT